MARNFFKFAFIFLFASFLSLNAVSLDTNDNTKVFVDRLYNLAFDRKPDFEGEKFWIAYINDFKSAKEAVNFFVKSKEFENRNLSKEEFVKKAFLIFTQLLPDDSKINQWVNKIDKDGRASLINALNKSEYFDILVNAFFDGENMDRNLAVNKIIEKLHKNEKGFYDIDDYLGYIFHILGVKFFDVRTKEEYAKSHPKDSINVEVYYNENGHRVLNPNFVKEIEVYENNKSAPLIVMCAHGHRSRMAGELLKEAGYKKVFSLKDGFSDKPGSWEKLDLPIER